MPWRYQGPRTFAKEYVKDEHDRLARELLRLTTSEAAAAEAGSVAEVVVEDFLTSGSWVCPEGVTVVWADGWGAGSGGGGGARADNASNTIAAGGGGGGGGAERSTQIAVVTPGETYTISIPAGGAGGAGASADATEGTDAAAGGDTTFVGTGVSLTFLGASAVAGGGWNASVVRKAPGGRSSRSMASPTASAYAGFFAAVASDLAWRALYAYPGGGGSGGSSGTTTQTTGDAGLTSREGYAGGAGGATGADSTGCGGSGGGGGGGGPGGIGAAGGQGGAGSTTTGSVGVAGSDAPANSGAGGGGGGGGGNGATASGNGGKGGAGGSGRLRLIYVLP